MTTNIEHPDCARAAAEARAELVDERDRLVTLSRRQAEELTRLHTRKNQLRDALMAERELNVAMRDEDRLLRNSEIPPRYWQARIDAIDKVFAEPNI